MQSGNIHPPKTGQTRNQRKRKALEARVAAQVERAKEEERAKAARAAGGARDKGKGKDKGKGFSLPQALVRLGCSSHRNGDPICYAYNLGGCTHTAPGGRCGRGLHVCAKCFELHSATEKHS